MFSLPTFSAHHLSADIRFLMVPGERFSASQRSTSFSTCLGLRLWAFICRNPIASRWSAIKSRMCSRSAGGVAAVAVVATELLQVVVQIAHRYLPSSIPAKIFVDRFLLLPWCVCTSGSVCSPGAPMAAAGGTSEHGTPRPLCAVGLLLAGSRLRPRLLTTSLGLARRTRRSRQARSTGPPLAGCLPTGRPEDGPLRFSNRTNCGSRPRKRVRP